MENLSYPIMEHFGTLQGEGNHTGKAAYFVRLSGCDVGCVWCDVKESWDINAGKSYTVGEILSFSEGYEFIVLTGGEPSMHDLTPLTKILHDNKKYIALETSGCYPLQGNVDWYTFSPKKFKPPIHEAYEKANELKIIIYHRSDFDWAEKHAEKVSSNCMLYLQPEWDKREEIQPLIVDYIKRNPKWRLSLQTHKYLNIP